MFRDPEVQTHSTQTEIDFIQVNPLALPFSLITKLNHDLQTMYLYPSVVFLGLLGQMFSITIIHSSVKTD